MAHIEQKLSERKDQIGIFKNLNLLNKDEEVKRLNDDLSSQESIYDRLESEKKDIEKNIEDMEEDIVTISDRLSGKNKGVLETLRSMTSNIAGKMKAFKTRISELVDRMGETVPTILNLMALFAFRVMILPLVFLYLFLKGFKLIWNIEFTELVGKVRPKDGLPDTSKQHKVSEVT